MPLAFRLRVRDLGLKLAALLLAVLLLWHVRTEGPADHRLALPIRYDRLASDLVVREPRPDKVDVLVRANGKQVLQYILERPVVRVDLSEARAGRVVQKLLGVPDVTPAPPPGAELLEIVEPRSLSLEVDELINRRLKVQPAVTSRLPAGRTLRGQPAAQPAEVTATGPRGILDRVDFVRTEPIDLTTLDSSSELEVNLARPGAGVILSPTRVRVSLAVEPLVQRVLRDLPVRVIFGKAAAEGLADPPTATVTVLGPEASVSLLKPDNIRVWMDARNLLAGRHPLIVQVDLPEGGLTLVSVTPDHGTAILR